MKISPLAGKPAPVGILVDVPRLITAYYTDNPDPALAAQRVAFGTSGHRGTSLNRSFNEPHLLAITQAICLYRTLQAITGPLFLGIDTHALSVPARASALEVLAANGVEVRIAADHEYTPTPVISHAILGYNRARTSGLADGIIITPSHNPPQDGGLKYNPPHGGPAENTITAWIEAKANELLSAQLTGVKRISYEIARHAPTTQEHDYLTAYVNELDQVIDLNLIRESKLRLGVDPLGGAGVYYWARIAERYGLDLTVVNSAVDPTFRFMSVDWDGQIRMDPSSPYAMASLIGMKDKFDLSFACDTDHDRQGIVTPRDGLLPPNHFLAVAIHELIRNRPQWPTPVKIGKTVVSSAMIDRVTAQLGGLLYEVPVGFKWFAAGLREGSMNFAGEESAGATFLRRDGRVWTTDKDGFIPCLLAAEITARSGRDPGKIYSELIQQLGNSFYDRVEAPATPTQKSALAGLDPEQVKRTEFAGEKIEIIRTHAPGNGALLGGLKIETANGWFAARPSGTEAIYKIYAESFIDEAHLHRILDEAQSLVGTILEAASEPNTKTPPGAPFKATELAAIEAWKNEGDPNSYAVTFKGSDRK